MTELPLGKEVAYKDTYSPELLFPISRKISRDALGISTDLDNLPFAGEDIWNAYELSWISSSGKPVLACAEFRFPCHSENIVESKSFKLYLNSFNQSRFDSLDDIQKLLQRDLSYCAGAEVEVILRSIDNTAAYDVVDLSGICLDAMDVTIDSYNPDPLLLSTANDHTDECLYSHLLRSLCPVTGQPDWGSVIVRYSGNAINHAGLLKYLIGYRQHQEFHEQCVERIFVDIMAQCKPHKLSVYARYVRRGGLDINPYRSTGDEVPNNHRLLRQ